MQNFYNIEKLPLFRDNVRNYTSTSYCRKGTNKDYGNCLYTDENGKYVIFDDMGYGMITKMFFPDINENTVLEFYFDNEETPKICATIKSIFSGECSFFERQFLHISNDFKKMKKSGYTCYQPLTYNSRLIIKIVTDDDFFYYHIDYIKSNGSLKADNNNIPSFHNDTAYEAKCVYKEKSQNIKVRSGKSEELIAVSGENSVIRNLRIRIPELQILKFPALFGKVLNTHAVKKSYIIHRNLYLSISFSGKENINVPFANFFGFSTFGKDRRAPEYCTKSIFFGADEDGFLYFKMPMPFSGSCKVRLINDSPFDLMKVDTEICYDSSVDNFKEMMPFYAAEINTVGDIRNNSDMRLIDLKGTGKYIGAVLDMDSKVPVTKGEYLEGDEHIYFDGSCSPQINGTGTEDYFCGAYYWQSGTQTTPYFGCIYNTKWADAKENKKDETYKASAYRVHLADAYQFSRRFVFDLEHGGTNETYEKVKGTVFYYLADSQCKEVAVNAPSVNPIEKTGCFEGDLSAPPVSVTVNYINPGDKISFQLESCQSAVLTRTIDYSIKNQCASVYLNGEYCGKWYDSGENPYCIFKGSEFILPTENLSEGAVVTICAETNWSFSDMKAIIKNT